MIMNELNDGSGGIATVLYTITKQQLSKTEKLKYMIKDIENGQKKFRKKVTNIYPKKKKRK